MLVVDSQPTLELYRECGFNSLLRHHSTRPELRRGARSWQAVRRAEANVLSERSESKGSQQLGPLHTLTATAAQNSPVREDRRGATVGQFAGKRRGWPPWAGRTTADLCCGPDRARGTLASGMRRLACLSRGVSFIPLLGSARNSSAIELPE